MKLLERQQMYGYELVETLAKRSDGVLAMGQSTLYPLLYNLEAKGLVKSSWRDMPSGRQRKYYRLTKKGKTQLASSTRQWRALSEAMQNLGIIDGPVARPGATA